MADKVTFTAIICTRNRPEDLEVCLQSLTSQTYPFTEIFVVDSSDDNSSQDIVNEFQESSITINYLKTEKGLTYQRNKGIENVKPDTDFLCFFDDDVVLNENYLFEAVKSIVKLNDKIAGFSGNTENEKPISLPERMLRRFFLITDYSNGKFLLSGDAGHIHSPDEDAAVSVLSGCNMCYNTKIINSKKLRFDEKLKEYAFMEDQDFSMRAGKFGKLYQFSNARLIHNESPVSRLKLDRLFEMYIINSYYLLKKNFSPGFIKYLFYWWRISGKLIQAIFISLSGKTSAPVRGWISGIINRNRLS